jgi:hypothetical protein
MVQIRPRFHLNGGALVMVGSRSNSHGPGHQGVAPQPQDYDPRVKNAPTHMSTRVLIQHAHSRINGHNLFAHPRNECRRRRKDFCSELSSARCTLNTYEPNHQTWVQQLLVEIKANMRRGGSPAAALRGGQTTVGVLSAQTPCSSGQFTSRQGPAGANPTLVWIHAPGRRSQSTRRRKNRDGSPLPVSCALSLFYQWRARLPAFSPSMLVAVAR